MAFKAVIFDLDGTLLDTLQDLAEAGNTALAQLGYPGHPADAYRRFVGNGVEHLGRMALPETARDSATVMALAMAMREAYSANWSRATRPYPGIPELIERLAAAGVPMAVLSNKPDAFTRIMVEHFFPARPFREVRGERPGVPRKPDPSAALDVARSLGVTPADFRFLGDSDVDMLTARAAGMVPVGALWGFRGPDELRRSGAEALLASPQELLRLLD